MCNFYIVTVVWRYALLICDVVEVADKITRLFGVTAKPPPAECHPQTRAAGELELVRDVICERAAAWNRSLLNFTPNVCVCQEQRNVFKRQFVISDEGGDNGLFNMHLVFVFRLSPRI